MAKDYFQDIIPPDDAGSARSVPIHKKHESVREAVPEPDTDDFVNDMHEDVPPTQERSIRNINIARRTPELREDRMPPIPPLPPIRRGSGNGMSRWLVWAIAAVAVVVLAILALFFFRKTTVTIMPRSQTVTFDQNSQFTAYPAAAAATGTLPYMVTTVDLSDSQVVQAQGTEHADVKASGNITVYNDYSTSQVTLIKNTRFETPDGLVYRVPDQIVVPGKKGSTPGQVTVTVQADQSGANYNVGPVSKLTLPGLKNNPSMYNNIYAQSSAAFTGGFSGDRPAAAPGAVESALAAVRARLQAQAQTAAQSSSTTTVLSDLVTVTYQDDPQTTEAGGGVRIHETAHVQIPQIVNTDLAAAVAQNVGVDTTGTTLKLVPGQGFAIRTASSTGVALGIDPLQLTLDGTAQLVWDVDSTALAQALAGKSSAAFQTITQGFSGIQQANARIEPFWKTTFPGNPADIRVVIETPKASK